MIALSIESTKDIVYEYIILIKKGIDKTEEVIKLCQSKWNLNLQIVYTELKLREARKLGFDMTKNFRRLFLRQVFTQWHDSDYNDTIENYAFMFHGDCTWYKQHINNNVDNVEEIISFFETHNNTINFINK